MDTFPFPLPLLMCTDKPLFDQLELTFCPICRRQWCRSWRPGTARSRRRSCWARTRCTTARWRTSYWVSVPSTTHNWPQRPTHNYIPQWPTSYQNRPQWPTVSLKGPKKASMSLVGFSGLKQDIMDLKWPQLIKALNSFRLCYTFSRYLPS